MFYLQTQNATQIQVAFQTIGVGYYYTNDGILFCDNILCQSNFQHKSDLIKLFDINNFADGKFIDAVKLFDEYKLFLYAYIQTFLIEPMDIGRTIRSQIIFYVKINLSPIEKMIRSRWVQLFLFTLSQIINLILFH